MICWFKELFSVDICQVLPLPHFHLLGRDKVLYENTKQLSFSSIKKKPPHPRTAFVFLLENYMKFHCGGALINSSDYCNDVSVVLKFLAAKS